jgi:hypothetical protein
VPPGTSTRTASTTSWASSASGRSLATARSACWATSGPRTRSRAPSWRRMASGTSTGAPPTPPHSPYFWSHRNLRHSGVLAAPMLHVRRTASGTSTGAPPHTPAGLLCSIAFPGLLAPHMIRVHAPP